MADSLHAAQMLIMEEVPYLQKTTSAELNYTFLGEADLIRKVRAVMLKHGVTVHPKHAEIVGSYEAVRGRSQSTWRGTRVLITYRFRHTSGDYDDVQAFGEALDGGDKALAKSMTIALKYALRQWLLIETGDDPDEVVHHRGEPEEALFRKAVEKLHSCSTIEAVESQLEKIQSATLENGSPVFTEHQVAELAMYAGRRRGELCG